MKKLASTAMTAVLALSLVGCGGSSSAGTSENKNILRFGLSGLTGTYNPFIFSTVYDNWVCSLIFEPLVTNDKDGNFVPYLADWTVSDDEKTYTFTLKDGIKFSDGNAMTADDVAYSFNLTKEDDYAGPRGDLAAAIDKIDVIDDKTVAFTFTEASPVNISRLAGYGILEKSHYEHDSWDALTALNTDPIGSGPLVLDSYAANQYTNLKKNENYWDSSKKLQIDGVSMTNVTEDTILSALQSGEIDLCQPAAKKENVDGINEMDNAHLISYVGNGYTYMQFNCTPANPDSQYHHTGALQDQKVRQALMYALDRKTFIKNEYGSDELASVGMAPFSPVSWAFPDSSELNAYDYDLDKAKSLLDEAGWTDTDGDGIRDKDGDKLELNWLVYTDSTWPGTLSSMAIDSWGQIGVKLNVVQMDFATVASTVQDPEPGAKDFDIYTMGWQVDIDPDPTGGIFDADAGGAGGYDSSGLYDERSQELLHEGVTEFDQTKRAEIYKEWAVRQNDLLATAVVAYRNEIWGVANRVKGLDDLSAYMDWTKLIFDVSLDQA